MRGGKTGDSKTNYDTNAVMLVRPWIKTMTEERKGGEQKVKRQESVYGVDSRTQRK